MPYNAWLLAKYHCHLNVEVMSSIRSIKYMFKYTYKGHDRAGVEVKSADDVLRYLDTRYVGPPEAVWRLLAFPMHGRSHVVERLFLHLENQQRVTFAEGAPHASDADQQLQESLKAAQRTPLLEYFAMNALVGEIGDLARDLIPVHVQDLGRLHLVRTTTRLAIQDRLASGSKPWNQTVRQR